MSAALSDLVYTTTSKRAKGGGYRVAFDLPTAATTTGEVFEAAVAEAKAASMTGRQKEILLTPFPRNNDGGNKDIFIDYYGPDYRGIEEETTVWVHWNEGISRYEKLEKGQIYEACKPAVEDRLSFHADGLFAEAEALELAGDTKRATDRRKAATKMQNRAENAGNKAKMDAYLSLVREATAVKAGDFDTAERTFGVGNGALRWDGERWIVRKPSRDDLLFKNTGVRYVHDAESAYVTETLDFFIPDLKLRRDVFRVLGYCAMRENPERKIVVLQGETATGKSTMIDLLQQALGEDYARSANFSLFRNNGDRPNPELLDVLWTHVALLSEATDQQALFGDVLKRIAGGQDKMVARTLFSKTIVKDTPWFTPVIATNAMFQVPDADAALKDRVLVLPFTRQMPPERRSGGHVHTAAEREHFLRLLMDGMADFLINGLGDLHPDIVAATRRAHSEMSFVSSWTAEHFRGVADGQVPRKGRRVILDSAWREFSDAQDREGVSRNEKLDKRQFKGAMRDAYGALNRSPFKVAGSKNSYKRYDGIEWRDSECGI
ncbi:hypothetical protein ACFVX3_30220 [Rhodococcus erythropolis]